MVDCSCCIKVVGVVIGAEVLVPFFAAVVRLLAGAVAGGWFGFSLPTFVSSSAKPYTTAHHQC